MFPDMVARAKEAGKRVILDFRGRDLLASLPHRPDAIKPNLAEFLETFLPDHPADAPEEETVIAVAARMMELAEEFGTAPVVTRGSADTLAVVDGEPLRIPVNEVAPVNTTGCGDAFAAGLALGLSAGEPLGEAIRWAHDAAARCAATGKPGSLL
jgi:1-phosphofructokinase/tagatose 6-phosphate kinase